MNVLFAHDDPIIKDENSIYYSRTFTNTMFKRYFTIGENLSIITRQKDLKNVNESMSKITLKHTNFIKVPDLSNIKNLLFNKEGRRIIEDAVISNDYIVTRLPSVIGMLAYDFAKKYNKPCLVEVAGCAWDAHWNHSLKGKVAAPFMYLNIKKRIKNSKYSVYVTNEFLQKRYPTDGLNTNCSNVALTEFDDNIMKNRLTKIEETEKREKVVIGTTASVDVRYKGQQYIIEALGKLKENGITHFEYQLVGAGDSSYLQRIAKKYNVEEQVKFLGSMPHNRVYDWLESIDMYVQPSKQEGLPRALIEAMSRALPAFGAKTAGIPELLQDEYIFSNSSKNIKEIINLFLSIDKESLKNQAIRNYNEAKKYNKSSIENRRKDFFIKFKNSYYQ